MKRLIAVGVTLTAAVPAVASAQGPTPQHARQYARVYSAVAHKLGSRAPGRNILRWGVGTHRASDGQIQASLGVLERMLNPAPVYQAPAASSSQTQPTASTSSGGYSIPSSIVQCESGGNYSAVNPSSGAGGAYQILPSTWQAYGGSGSPSTASKAEQDAIAAKIYAGGAGRGQWSC